MKCYAFAPPRKEGTGEDEKIVAAGDMLIFVSGHRPIYGRQMLYFFDPILKSRAEIPPPRQFYCIRNGALIPQEPFFPLRFSPTSTAARLRATHRKHTTRCRCSG